MTKPKASKPNAPGTVVAQSHEDAAALIATMTPEERAEASRRRASAIVNGTYTSAHVSEVFGRRVFSETSLQDVVLALSNAGKEVASGDTSRIERLLTGQIVALNNIFADCAMRSHGNMGEYMAATETYMRLALKAQAQCARTAEVLGNLRAGPTIFAKQANIANGPQQVNNGVAPARTQDSANLKNELSGGSHELLPDARASQAASRLDTPMEAVGEVHRPKD